MHCVDRFCSLKTLMEECFNCTYRISFGQRFLTRESRDCSIDCKGYLWLQHLCLNHPAVVAWNISFLRDLALLGMERCLWKEWKGHEIRRGKRWKEEEITVQTGCRCWYPSFQWKLLNPEGIQSLHCFYFRDVYLGLNLFIIWVVVIISCMLCWW